MGRSAATKNVLTPAQLRVYEQLKKAGPDDWQSAEDLGAQFRTLQFLHEYRLLEYKTVAPFPAFKETTVFWRVVQ